MIQKFQSCIRTVLLRTELVSLYFFVTFSRVAAAFAFSYFKCCSARDNFSRKNCSCYVHIIRTYCSTRWISLFIDFNLALVLRTLNRSFSVLPLFADSVIYYLLLQMEQWQEPHTQTYYYQQYQFLFLISEGRV